MGSCALPIGIPRFVHPWLRPREQALDIGKDAVVNLEVKVKLGFD